MAREFKADPEKYKQLCRPHDSVEMANEVAKEFLNAVSRLREQYRIPELVVQFELYADSPEGPKSMYGGAGWGDQMQQARLMKDAADREFNYLATLVQQIAATLPKARALLVTDPRGSDLESK